MSSNPDGLSYSGWPDGRIGDGCQPRKKDPAEPDADYVARVTAALPTAVAAIVAEAAKKRAAHKVRG